jgi:thiosulfate/3-mercaptopyruvate sulfurtransferase
MTTDRTTRAWHAGADEVLLPGNGMREARGGGRMSEMGEERARPLVDVAWVREHLHDTSVVVVEVGADAGAYHEGHVPGATALSWLDDLNERDRRGVLSRHHLEQLLSVRGISRDTHVVLYGEQDNVFAAYAYWVLRYYGHPRVSLLDGGRRAWLAAGAPLTDEPPHRLSRRYVAADPDDTIRLTRQTLLDGYLDARSTTGLVDCRSQREYHGHPDTATDLPLLRHRLGGHIPGARNIPSTELLDPATGRLRPLDELRDVFAAEGIRSDRDVAVYCDVGGRSALAWFVLHDLLGFRQVRVYEGGWAEYGSLVAAPISR